jgi:hypothetical protein
MADQLLVAILTTLLNQPNFHEGIREGILTFEEGMFAEDLDKAWTEDDIIEFVDSELSKQVYQRTQLTGRVMNWEIPPYLTHLGFTFSYLALILSAKANQQQEQGGEDAAG